jgi:MFS family permease
MTSRLTPAHIAIQIAACLGFLVVQLDVSVVNVALGPLKAAFSTDLTGLQWVINSYALIFSALLILGGVLGDKFGARAVFVFGFVTFTLASIGCGLAHTCPMLPRRLATNRVLASASLCGAVINMTFYGTVFALSIYYQTILHYSPLQTGVAFIPLTAVLTASSVVSSRVARTVSANRIITVGFLLQAAGFLALSRLSATTPVGWLNAALVLVGIGSAVSVPSITNSMLSAVSKNDAGVASGLMATARQMGGVVGVALFGTLISSRDSANFMRGMSHAMLTACCALVATLLVLRKVPLANQAHTLNP